MAFKGLSAFTACIGVLALLTVWLLFRRTVPPTDPYTDHLIAINKLLYKLRKECVTGQIEIAQNTIEDVRQEWEYLDVISHPPTVCPSDSLQTLDSLVRLMLNKDDSKRLIPTVLGEINALNNRLDKVY